MDSYEFPTDPVAEQSSVVSGPNYRFTVIDPRVLRYEWSHDGVFEDRASTFAINRKFKTPKFTVRDTDDHLEIVTPDFHLFYDKQRFSPNGLHVTFSAKVTLWGSEWRYGSEPQGNLGGTARTLDEVDGRCDLGHGILSRAGYSVLDDSTSMLFDGKGFVAPRRSGDRIDGYLFCYGHDYKEVMRSFYAISGSQPRVPRWALGNWWSRYHEYSAESYLALMDKFKEHEVPLSVAVVDMDWHLVGDDRVPHAGWTGYTWNDKLFPDPVAFGKALHDRGLKITLNDHPHSGLHHHEDDYEEVAAALKHDTSDKLPVLFNPTSPEFMHTWLNILHRNLEKQGCDFWWIDWQQGPISRIPGVDPLWLLNHFHFVDNEKEKGKDQALIFSRYAGPGSHRYPVGFSGDSIVTWESLQFQPEFTATASNIGYGWWSHDIGGHMGGYRDDELTTRWVQYAVFSPILRLHSSNSRWASKEPWLYRNEFSEQLKEALRFRHRLVPYVFSAQMPKEGWPVMPLVQPMYWSYPERDEAYWHPNQYTFGDAMVVAPIVQPRDKRTNRAFVNVWVPPGRHIDMFNGAVYDGDREINVYRTIDAIPVLINEGSIVPLDNVLIPLNGCTRPESIQVMVVVGKDAETKLLNGSEDGSKGSAADKDAIEFTFSQETGRFEAHTDNPFVRVKFLGLLEKPKALKVLVNGNEEADSQVSIERGQFPGLMVAVMTKTKGRSHVSIEVGENPQLSVVDDLRLVEDMLLDWQIDYAIKDKIWAVVSAPEQPVSVKVGRLLGLGLDDAVVGPIVEALWADSRVA